MRRRHRLILLALFVAAAPVLAGCENFDPDSLDIFHLNDKKKLPGERKEVFPGGVPGVTQGVPPEYMKGYQPPQTANADETLPPGAKVNPGDEDAAAALKPGKKTAAIEPAQKPKPKKPKAKAKTTQPAQVTIQAPAQGQQSPWPAANQQQQQPQQAQSPWPAPSQNEAPSPWPAPPAPGTFSKQ